MWKAFFRGSQGKGQKLLVFLLQEKLVCWASFLMRSFPLRGLEPGTTPSKTSAANGIQSGSSLLHSDSAINSSGFDLPGEPKLSKVPHLELLVFFLFFFGFRHDRQDATRMRVLKRRLFVLHLSTCRASESNENRSKTTTNLEIKLQTHKLITIFLLCVCRCHIGRCGGWYMVVWLLPMIKRALKIYIWNKIKTV
jgi:hypothetical protein